MSPNKAWFQKQNKPSRQLLQIELGKSDSENDQLLPKYAYDLLPDSSHEKMCFGLSLNGLRLLYFPLTFNISQISNLILLQNLRPVGFLLSVN